MGRPENFIAAGSPPGGGRLSLPEGAILLLCSVTIRGGGGMCQFNTATERDEKKSD